MALGTCAASECWAREQNRVHAEAHPEQPMRGEVDSVFRPRRTQGDRKVPSSSSSLKLAAERNQLPSGAVSQSVMSGQLAAFPCQPSHDEQGPRLVQPESWTREQKKDKKRTKEQAAAARIRHYDNVLARARPDLPGTVSVDFALYTPRNARVEGGLRAPTCRAL